MSDLNIESIEDVKFEHPDFKLQWIGHQYGGMENPNFGKIEHIVACDVEGKPLFDQYIITENSGAIVIPWDEQNGNVRIGLVTQYRFVPAREYVEAVRGFGKENETATETAYRELFEETGLKAGDVKIIGRINPNTAFYTTDIPVVAAKVSKIEELANCGGDGFVEKIKKVAPFDLSELWHLEMECGLTTAAIFKFTNALNRYI